MKRILGLFALSLLMGGCWDVNSLETLGYVNLLAVDYQGGRYDVAIQVLNPSNIPLATAGQSAAGPPVWVAEASGDTIGEAVERISERYPKRLFWGHLEGVVVGPEFAEKRLFSLWQFIGRTPHLRTIAWFFVSKKPRACALLRVAPAQEPYPGQAVSDFASFAVDRFGVYPSRLNEFLKALPGYGREPFAAGLWFKPALTPPTASDFDIDSLAFFRGSRLTGWADRDGTLGLLALRSRIRSETLLLKREGITLRLVDTSSVLRVRKRGDRPTALTADVTIRIALEGLSGPAPGLNRPGFRSRLETAAAQHFARLIEKGVLESQRAGSDVPGFGDALRQTDERLWTALAPKWDKAVYPRLPLRHRVRAVLVGIGETVRGY